MALILIPAAGASSRMRGEDKLLREIDGEPLLRRQVRAALATGHPALVTLPTDRPARCEALRDWGPDLSSEILPDANDGLSRSLKAGAAEAGRRGLDLLVLLPDMPDIETEDIATLLAAKEPGDIVCRATAEDGTPGHPVLFDRSLLPDFADLSGDRGAASILKRHPPKLVPLAGNRACRDLDTPEDWADYMGERARPR
ncbi:nucleotidyltransferase family protein [Histidinibacterium aquaticum]|uniref:Nucleotidyltransferase family protein n=1 Tax=Histidinibacterium aquaticum TaxID=2613962 RepID=A0A5J5GLM6_9RHOB|nr:nucleotidyltransferase family protein [Histidinibacterium aquaticum]KAA9009171.1 nucleotidyltransferase family protein [Histidinibacterium aquaticum]